MHGRASLFFLVALAACDRKPKTTFPPATPQPNASASAKPASIEMPTHGGSRPTEPCTSPTCVVTQTTIDITPYGTSNVAAVGDDVWFLHQGEAALLKRGAGDKQDVVLAADVRVTADTWMSQMLVENDTAYFATSKGVVSWNRKTSALTTLTPKGPTNFTKRIALDKTHVYFAAADCRYLNGQSGACVGACLVARVPKTGGKVEELTAVTLPPEMACEFPMLTVDEASVWFTPGATGELLSISTTKAKAPRKVIFSKKGVVWGLTVDADNVYVLAGDSPHVKLYRIPKKEGPVALMREDISVGAYYSLESDASQLYFFDVGEEKRVLAAMPKSGGARRVLATFSEREDPMTIVPAPSSLFLVVFHRSETPEENQAYLWRIGK